MLQKRDGIMHYDKDKLLEIGNKNEQAETDCLRGLISIPTCYYKKHDMKSIVALLTKEFKERGYKVQAFPTAGAPIIVADLDRRMKKTLLFYNHYDVQPEEPLSEWKSPPYELSIKNERLYGRGVLDNKGPIVANLFGIQNALEAGYELECNVRFVIEGEEEAGSTHLSGFCRAHSSLLKSDGCIWEWARAVPNQRSRVYAGVKGNVYFELHAKGFSKDAHSGDAPIVINPAWRLVWALSTLKNDREEVLIDGFYDDVVPPRKEELELFENYPPEQIEQCRQLYKTDEFLLGREGAEFWKELIFGPTCSICGLSAGWEGPGSKTVIGKDAMAKVDFRLVPNQNAAKIQELLRRHLDKQGFSDIEMKLLEGYGPSRTAIDSPFIKLLAKLAKDFSGQESILIPSSQGSGPAHLFGAHTPWAICEIFDPEANTHAPNESMRLKDFRYMTAFIAATAIELGKN
jgi:acetylornithine deacetylase/succinyl-diaminopimelate desuccinylase-like protein